MTQVCTPPETACPLTLRKGENVEVTSDEEGYVGAWFAAQVIRKNQITCIVEYDELLSDDGQPLHEEVRIDHMRPRPPELEQRNWMKGDAVEAYDRDGWWAGIVSKVLRKKTFIVYFQQTAEEMLFPATQLRSLQEWRDGRWTRITQTWRHGLTLDIRIPADVQGLSLASMFSHENLEFAEPSQLLPNSVEILMQDFQGCKQKCRDIGKRNYRRAVLIAESLNTDSDHGCNSQRERARCIGKRWPVKWKKPAASTSGGIPQGIKADQKFNWKGTTKSENSKARRIGRKKNPSSLKAVGHEGCIDGLNLDDKNFPLTGFESPTEKAEQVKVFEGMADGSSSDLHWSEQTSDGNNNVIEEPKRLELVAYHWLLQALYSRGSISWKHEMLLTDARCLLHISNDEHAREIWALISSNNVEPGEFPRSVHTEE